MLIIDDIGADFSIQGIRKNDYNATLFSIINFRNTNHRTTLYTSNLYNADLIRLGIDERSIDRLEEMIEYRFTLEGESIRGKGKQG